MGYIYNKGVNKVEDDIIVIEKDMLPLREDVTLKEMCKSLATGLTIDFFVDLLNLYFGNNFAVAPIWTIIKWIIIGILLFLTGLELLSSITIWLNRFIYDITKTDYRQLSKWWYIEQISSLILIKAYIDLF
jgi:hypothetical protein